MAKYGPHASANGQKCSMYEMTSVVKADAEEGGWRQRGFSDHHLHRPSFDHLIGSKRGRSATLVATVKLCAIKQAASIVALTRCSNGWVLNTAALDNDFILQTAWQRDHVRFSLILLEEREPSCFTIRVRHGARCDAVCTIYICILIYTLFIYTVYMYDAINTCSTRYEVQSVYAIQYVHVPVPVCSTVGYLLVGQV